MSSETRTIEVDYLARVEGEGAFHLTVEDGEVREACLSIFEPPRFFEALLRGRDFAEAPDITARICGICPVAYQMSAVHAMEAAANVAVPPGIRALRRLLYCGEWIESHTLHVYMLHAPDFLGLHDAVQLARAQPGVVERGLRLKKAGNAIVRLIGGREIHPINVRVGGFYRVPSRRALEDLVPELEWARDAARETLEWAATLPFPEIERDYVFVALREGTEYPFNEGRILSSQGLNIATDAYDDHFEEVQVPHSTALHSRLAGGGAYLTGPLARYALNRDLLPAPVQEAAQRVGLGEICRNPYRSILVRAVEILFACEEALRLITAYEAPAEPFIEVEPRGTVGRWATEAPRGLLYHRYQVDDGGLIADAKIVPPTSQNQASIQDDLREVAGRNLALADDALRALCEQTIRNHDPCISCAAHFLRLEVERR